MKPLNEKLQKGVRAIAFALVATASIGAALAMKPVQKAPIDHKTSVYIYGVADYDETNWKVIADVTSPETEYICETEASTTCKVNHNGLAPLSPNDLIPKDEAYNPQPGRFEMP